MDAVRRLDPSSEGRTEEHAASTGEETRQAAETGVKVDGPPAELVSLLEGHPQRSLFEVVISGVEQVTIRTGISLSGVASKYIEARIVRVHSVPDSWRYSSGEGKSKIRFGAEVQIVNKPWNSLGVPVRTLEVGSFAWVVCNPPGRNGLLLVSAARVGRAREKD